MPNLPTVKPGQIIEANAWNNVLEDLNILSQALEIVDPWSDQDEPKGGDLRIKGQADNTATLYLHHKDAGYFIRAENTGDSGSLSIAAQHASTGIVISAGGDTRIGGGSPARAKLEIDGGDTWLNQAWQKSLLLTGGKPARDNKPPEAGAPSIIFTSQASDTKFALGFEHKSNKGKLHIFSSPDAPLWTNGSGGGEPKSHLVVQEDGNVGIGTIEPQAKLDIEGGPDWTILKWKKSIKIHDKGAIQFGDFLGIGVKGNTLQILDTTDINDPSTRIFIQSSGNVGMGIDDPKQRLEIGGNLSLHGNLFVNNTLPIRIVLQEFSFDDKYRVSSQISSIDNDWNGVIGGYIVNPINKEIMLQSIHLDEYKSNWYISAKISPKDNIPAKDFKITVYMIFFRKGISDIEISEKM